MDSIRLVDTLRKLLFTSTASRTVNEMLSLEHGAWSIPRSVAHEHPVLGRVQSAIPS